MLPAATEFAYCLKYRTGYRLNLRVKFGTRMHYIWKFPFAKKKTTHKRNHYEVFLRKGKMVQTIFNEINKNNSTRMNKNNCKINPYDKFLSTHSFALFSFFNKFSTVDFHLRPTFKHSIAPSHKYYELRIGSV